MSDTSENYSPQQEYSPSQGNSQSKKYSQSQEDTPSQGNSPTQDNSNSSQGNSPTQDNSNSSKGNSPSQDTSNSSQGNSPSQDTSNTDDNNNNKTPSDSSDSPPAPSANTDDNNNTPSNSSPSESSPESQSQNTPNKNSPPAPKSGGGHDGSSNAPPANDNSHNNGNRSQSPPSNKISGQPSDKSKEDDFGRKVAIGLLVGGVLLLLVFCLFITRCIRNKRKKKKQQNDIPYYQYASAVEKGGQMYYMGQPQGHWQPPPDHVVKLNSQAVGMSPHAAGMSPGSPWGLPAHLLPGAVVGESTGYSTGPHLPPLPPPSPGVALGMNKSSFTYEDLSAATNGFSDANILGQGGFGYVHKGILPDGKEVAVKSLKAGSGQGEREFQAEVDIISRVHHRHLVSLYGYCISGGQRMLVYEFVPNMTMEHHLHGKNLPVMDFQTRLRIALGSAKGLAYLHEDCHPKIIHRDIKASNILLENNFEARVSDFGLAKLSADNFTHVSTRVMGTFGYLAPEYASSGKLTDKSDVFSYGVMLLELITGKQPVDNTGTMDDSLVDWARPLLTQSMEDGNFDQLVDPRLQQNYNPYEMKRMMAAAAASIRHSAKKRPKMSQIVRALEGNSSLDDLNDGVKPGHSSIFSSPGGSSDLSRGSYNAELKKLQADSSSSGEFVASSRDGTPTHKANMP